MRDREEIQALNSSLLGTIKEVVRETIREAIREGLTQRADESPFPLYTTRRVGQIFNVSAHTVRSWFQRGLLPGRYQVLSGRSCRLVFCYRDLVEFLNENFPHPEDFGDHPCSPRRSRIGLIQRMLKMNRLYARRRLRPRPVSSFSPISREQARAHGHPPGQTDRIPWRAPEASGSRDYSGDRSRDAREDERD